MLKPTLFLLFIICATANLCNAQTSAVEKLVAWKKVTDKHNIEKVHIHTNQPFYSAYDTIWFKGYVIDTYYNSPSAISKLLYVTLEDPQGKEVRRTILPLTGGLANGYFSLNDSLQTGLYQVCAYTPNMKIFGAAYAYRRPVIIKSAKLATKALAGNPAPALQFFPEGGDMVQGISSVVAFKAIGANGLSTGVTGDVTDEAGKLVAKFASAHAGMGTFYFTPVAGHSYTAHAKFGNGSTGQVKLKDPLPTGYSLKVNHTGNQVNADISGSAPLNGPGQLTLVGMQDGVIRFANRLALTSASHRLTVPDSLFYSGVTQFTLFDPSGNPVAERLVFVNHNNRPAISAQFKSGYNAREKVSLPLSFKNISGQPEVGSLSVSVYNESELPGNDDDETSIYTDMLLTTDLKGYIESPGYYFNHTDTTVARHLDNLLLTQGWRRFSWKDKLSANIPVIPDSVGQSLEVTGHVEMPSGKPFKGQISLYQTGHPENARQIETDELGHFSFDALTLKDTARIIISTNTLADKKKNKITVNSDWLNIKPENGINNTIIDSLISNASRNARNEQLNNMQNSGRSTQLKEVQIKGTTKPKITHSDNLLGAGNADKIITAEDLTYQTDLLKYLENYVGGFKSLNGLIYSRGGADTNAMLIVYRGIQMEQGRGGFYLSDINVDEIQSIEILKGGRGSIYGTSNGVIIINSKTGADYAPYIRAVGLVPLNKIGYQSQREFYSPQYQPNAAPSNNKPDFRKAIYWNPNVVVLPGQSPQVTFFNSDYTGKCKVVVEGISADGSIARTIYSYEVKN